MLTEAELTNDTTNVGTSLYEALEARRSDAPL